MNVSPLIPVVMPVAQMPVAATDGHMLSFDQLMPRAELANSIVPALPEQMPSFEQVMPKAVAKQSVAAASPDQGPPFGQSMLNAGFSNSTVTLSQDEMPSFGQPMPDAAVTHSIVTAPAAVPPVMSDFPEKASADIMPEPVLKSAPEAKLQPNAPPPLPPVIALPFRTVTEAKPQAASIEESIKTPDDDTDECPASPEAVSLITRTTEAPVAIVPLPSGPLVGLKPAPTVTQREPEITNIIDLPSKSILTEKPATSIMPFQAALEIVHPAAITPSAAPSEPVATGHLDLARDTLWLDQLTREIVAVASSDGRLKFRLSPEILGNLDVAISTQADGVNIQLQPSTETAARILAAEQPKLTEELRQSGLKLVNSDLLGGQQMGNARDHSQTQHPDRWLPFRQSAQPTFLTQLNPAPMQPQRGRFA